MRSAGTPKSAVAILDGLAAVDALAFNPDGSIRDSETKQFGAVERGIVKAQRENYFPSKLIDLALQVDIEKGEATVQSDRVHILRAIAGLPPPTHDPGEDCDCCEPPAGHSSYKAVNRELRARLAAPMLAQALQDSDRQELYFGAIENSELRKIAVDLGGFEHDPDIELTPLLVARLIDVLPATLLELTLHGFGGYDHGYDENKDPSKPAELPDSFGKFTSLTSLDLSSDHFGFRGLDALPSSIGKLTALASLNLKANDLTMLPAEIGKLTALTSLNLAGNDLTMLPAEIGNLTALMSLNLESNKRMKALPAEIGKLTALTSLDLEGCCGLTALPAQIGTLTNLLQLNLNFCKKLRVLPESISRLPNLTISDDMWVPMKSRCCCCYIC